MRTFARPIELKDAETLKNIDKIYAQQCAETSKLTKGSLNFYIRTGHAFIAIRNNKAIGFVFAQAIWNGMRPTVFVDYIAVIEKTDLEARLIMLEAVTKSAYDAAVYHIQVQVFTKDTVAIQALLEKQYYEKPLRVYERILGSKTSQSEVV